ncbi:winged helix-turn-helix transcriptional regulator [Amycolatopsis rhizosphaerae]|uniref:Winged helix-turn-helix transcriptional regulator n=1 Tax=Amycolatopsis rhizosphaerae TaxID=2053003 RepID=A0A558BIP8_9PSEU|nr:winged helix-turn-helix domain-containing protein [Amycolatopsis rhizosphaerae]TVT36397.1 winged helix-turn-helix transcriptional regulator [Amycolatopsis rhizosphaerae]
MTNKPDDLLGYVYEWLADQLTERIKSGDLPPMAPLPAERNLAAAYGVSLGTARHATRVLRKRGLVITVRSKGTYVAPQEPDQQ